MSWSPETASLLQNYSINSRHESGISKVFFTAGPKNKVAIFVLKGVVRLSHLGQTTDLLRFIWPGEMFSNFSEGDISSYELKTVGKSQVIILSELHYKKLIEGNPLFVHEMIKTLSRMKYTSNNLMTFLKSNDTSLEARTAGLFLGLIGNEMDIPNNRAEITVPIPYTYLAELLRVDHCVFSRQLAKFVSRGLIEKIAPRRLSILDIQGLRNLSPQICKIR